MGLEQAGIGLTPKQFKKAASDLDEDGLSFSDFCTLVRKLMGWDKSKGRGGRNIRMYLVPDQVADFTKLFRERAGPEGLIAHDQFASFFAQHKMIVSDEKLQATIAEIDDDNCGFLDEGEFLILVTKAMALKKRKVGPGQCSLKHLKEEGWAPFELKRAGYECKHFMEAGFSTAELAEVFSARELRNVVPLGDLLASGWNCLHARDVGFELHELVKAGCSVERIREAGFDDLPSAAVLRRMGVTAEQMKRGGWPLSELRLAGFGSAELRCAGFSVSALMLTHQALEKRGLQRKDTRAFRLEADALFLAGKIPF